MKKTGRTRNKKTLERALENSEKRNERLIRLNKRAENKIEGLKIQMWMCESWINVLASMIGEEFSVDIKATANPPEYLYRYVPEQQVIEFKRKVEDGA